MPDYFYPDINEIEVTLTVVARMLFTASKNYNMIYAYAVSFIECIDTHN